MEFKPSANLADQIYHFLSERIIRCDYKPGERLVEDRLSKELRVSRSPLREALRLLEQDGMVELVPRHGVRVTRLTRPHIECLYDILTELYSLLVRQVVKRLTAENLEAITLRVDTIVACAASDDLEGYYRALFDLGSLALDIAEVPLLNQLITELWPSKRRVEYVTISLRRMKLTGNGAFFSQALAHGQAGRMEEAIHVIREYTLNEKRCALEWADSDLSGVTGDRDRP